MALSKTDENSETVIPPFSLKKERNSRRYDISNHQDLTLQVEQPENQQQLTPSLSSPPSFSPSSSTPLSPSYSAPPSLSSPVSPSPPPSTTASSPSLESNWQSTKKTLQERNAVMFNNPMMADVYFLVGGGISSLSLAKKIPAHKYVMATGSTVFFAMFYGGLADKDSTVIEVPDVEPVAFLTMMKYLYSDTISLKPDTVLSTLYCAKKYIVPHLARECVKYLETSLTAKNACVLLSHSRLFEEPELMQRCWEVIDAQASMALLAESFIDIDFDTLKTILKRETLNCKETVVFQAAVNWATARLEENEEDEDEEDEDERSKVEEEDKKNEIKEGEEGIEEEEITVMNKYAKRKRQILGDAMNMIRFPAMTVQDFADEVVPSGLLNLQEITDIFLHFTSTKIKPAIDYPLLPRRGLEIVSCHRFQSSAYRSNQWRYRGRCDSIQFCVDKPIFIVGYGLYGSSNGSAEYDASIELKDANGQSLAFACLKFQSDGSSNTFRVLFRQPVRIEPDVFYTASVVVFGVELSYFGQEGMSEKTVAGVTFQFQCSSDSTNGTGVQGGQIPELLLYKPSTLV